MIICFISRKQFHHQMSYRLQTSYKWTSFFIEYGATYPSCSQRKILHRLTGLNEKGLYLEEKKFTTFVIKKFF